MAGSKRTFGMGVIGCGVISDTHLAAIGLLPDARLVAVCDKNEAAARAKAEAHGCDCYTSHLELLERDDIDIVHLTVPSGLHARIGVDVVKAGKHIVVEKPIDIRLEAVDALIRAAEANGVKIGAIYQLRAYPAYRRLKQAVEEGRLGRLLHASAFVPWFRSDEYYADGWHGTKALDGGGALMNQSIHYIDLLLHLMGRATRVAGFTGTLAHDRIEVEDCGSAVVLFESGAQGLVHGSTCTYTGHPARVAVHGTRGNVYLEANEVRLWEVEGEPLERNDGPAAATAASDPRAGLDQAVRAHAAEIQDLIDAIREDRDPKLDGREARRAVELILAIYRSSETGEVADLPLV
jgi:UDP-N-acetyl-2-amino-2-deoxyglucuronate dehydrogenase